MLFRFEKGYRDSAKEEKVLGCFSSTTPTWSLAGGGADFVPFLSPDASGELSEPQPRPRVGRDHGDYLRALPGSRQPRLGAPGKPNLRILRVRGSWLLGPHHRVSAVVEHRATAKIRLGMKMLKGVEHVSVRKG